MAHIIITSKTFTFNVDLDGTSEHNKDAIIRKTEIRSVTRRNDDKSVMITFNDKTIKGFDFNDVDSIDGDSITTQLILRDKLSFMIFGETY